MHEGSPKRVAAEQQITQSLRSAKRHALLPFVVARAIGVFDAQRAALFYNSQVKDHKQRYHDANEALRRIEEEEGFPNIRAYTDVVQDVVSHVPADLRQAAYVPYAGSDVFWAAAFRAVVMEDVNYNTANDHPTAWWSVSDYSISVLDRLVDTLKTHGVIPIENDIDFLQSDSEIEPTEGSLNRPDVTLVHKAGHEFRPFVRNRFGEEEMRFGAIIISNDSSSRDSLQRLLAAHKYEEVYKANPALVANPWALSIKEPSVYLKR